jgi:hypothetical protein
MEHAFDKISKQLARGMSRREAISSVLRVAVGTFMVSAGFTKFSLRAQSGKCMACGTCQAVDFTTGAVTPCAMKCEAQNLCNHAQSYDPYIQLAAAMVGYGYEFSSYSAITVTGLPPATKVLNVAYTSAEGSTANLIVGWLSGGQMASYAISYDSSGKPINGYLADSSGDIQAILPIPLFVVSVSPTSVTVAQGSRATATVSVGVNSPFSSTIKLSASGLPSGATAKFNPASFPAPGSGSSTMTIKAAAKTPTGTYPVTITGTAEGAITQTAALSVVVVAPKSAASAFETPDEFAHSTLLLPVGDEPAAERPPTSGCETCDRFCDNIGDLAGIACASLAGALCLPSGALAAACGIAAGGFCVILIKQDCIDRCRYAQCFPPVCNSDNCQAPAMCINGTCVENSCSEGSVPCGIYCCPDSGLCCTDGAQSNCYNIGAGCAECSLNACCAPGEVVCPYEGVYCCPSDYECCSGPVPGCCPPDAPECCGRDQGGCCKGGVLKYRRVSPRTSPELRK